MDSTRISYLFNQLESNAITTGEKEELYSLLRSFENNDEILAWLEDSYQNTKPQSIDIAHWRPILEHILQQKQAKIVPLKPLRTRWIKWIAAASIIIIAAVATYTLISKRSGKSPAVAVTPTHDVPAPSNTRAVITLADGSKVYLDSAGNGVLAQENNVNILRNSEGEIQYMSPAGGGGLNDSPNNKRPGVDYNTLFNPRGSKVISLTLSDGSHVWLNSGSSIKYPVAFIGKERVVEITGEAYFEVKHNAQQPFKVHLPNGSIVEDIGTSFNINSYPDETEIKTTLIEGAVRVMSPAGGGDLRNTPNNKRPGVDDGVILKPGQQALLNPSIRVIRVQNNPDLVEVLAWKNGKFSFKGQALESIMRQVARWYDVEVVYESRVDDKFYADIPRDTKASDVLKALELTGKVHFKIEGKKITVMK